MSEANKGDPPTNPAPGGSPLASRRRRLLLGAGIVVVGSLVALVVALSDDGGEPRAGGGGSEGAAASYAPATEAEPARAAPSKAEPLPAVVVSTDAAAPPVLGGTPGSGSLVSASRSVAGAGGRGGRNDAAARAPMAIPSARGAAAPPARHPDGGAPASTSPDGGVRPLERKPSASDSARRATAKAEGDDRDQDDQLVLVARFAPTGGATLEGRIVDADSGRSVAGIAVEARHAGKYMKGTTDASGAFHMAGIIPGTRVVVWIGDKRDPYIAERIDVAIPGEGQRAEIGLVRLLRGDEMGPRLDGWVGLFVTRRGGRVTVSAVTPWLPADRAGVKVGDVVVSINGRDTAGFGPRAATFLLRGPPATSVSFLVEDHTAARRKLTLERVPR